MRGESGDTGLVIRTDLSADKKTTDPSGDFYRSVPRPGPKIGEVYAKISYFLNVVN